MHNPIAATKEQIEKSRAEQAPRKWIYTGNVGVLVETVDQYNTLKDLFNEDRPKSIKFKQVNYINALQMVRDAEEKIKAEDLAIEAIEPNIEPVPAKRGRKPKEE